MTTYGTIPTSLPAGGSSKLEFFSRAKDRIRADLGTPRPWKLMISPHSISVPGGPAEAAARVSTNASFFRMNYAIVVLFALFLGLLWHPISLIVFLVMMCAWLFLYFLRDEPLVIFNRTIDDCTVLMVLSVFTILFLFLTDVTVNIVVGLVVGVVVVVVHGVLRRTDDLVMVDEEEGEVGSGVAWRRLPLKETASSSFSSSS
ncbi:PRA1 family protein F2 [Camellia lanceoleosa]|uniref:PRA1 family protein F2 n=1 Tax=Camellia lanceoleosa TaxID=1840588 RepID=A0ACC0I9V0_9ERIC|nr:PRA1 family protein F2 [Camellia lanceoleosa]